MDQLVLDNFDHALLLKLEEFARKEGISVQEEHRKLLEAAITQKAYDSMDFVELLLAMPKAGPDEPEDLFSPKRSPSREIDLSE